MLLQQENDHAETAYYTHVHTLAGAEHAGQSRLALSVGAHLDPGIRRKHKPNEDTVLITHGVMPSASPLPKPFVLLAVADGIGGRGHGQKASQLAARSLVEYLSGSLCSKPSLPEELLLLLRASVQYANRVVYEYNQQQETAMGTTMTAALVSETTAYIAHVGDSRFYLYRKPTGLAQITHDHSVVAELVATGIIAPDDIYTHPKRNQIYRSLGGEASVEVDASVVPLIAGDILLLCSDGLWEMVRTQQIASILAMLTSTPSDTAQALIQAALAGGGEDNVSAIVAQVGNV
ncbi:MAG TPA: protein phosphatase 2C domain-containing protein [Ktedonobacteraceae bacterium]|nr:protein phosphatase 2C domain-containing protein [Ktedonobacteraceae bacterium]